MFDFLGTFNRSQFDRLAAFARDQLPLVKARSQQLLLEKSRLGTLIMVKDPKGRPTGYAASDPNSYLAKLLRAYEILGGNPFFDLRVRSMAEPVFLLKGDEVNPPRFFSNGEPKSEAALADAPSAQLVLQMRSWLVEAIDRKDYLERKIRRVIDYGDQLQAEIDQLEKITRAAEQDGSLEFIIAQVGNLLRDKNYRAIADDKGKDPFGQYTRAPFSAYDPGPNRGSQQGEGVERTAEGYFSFGDEEGSSSGQGTT